MSDLHFIQSYCGVLALIILVYWAPALVALLRRHPMMYLIAFLNVALGFTGLVWIGVGIWSVWPIKKREPVTPLWKLSVALLLIIPVVAWVICVQERH